MNDPHNLQRFVDAQDKVLDVVLEELRAGHKETHWIWFIFPQLKGLGHSFQSNHFGIASLSEAQAYLQHPLLGPRLRECTQRVNLVEGRTIEQIFGYPDDLKFRSSMTLFAHATSDKQPFVNAVNRYFSGEYDAVTLERIAVRDTDPRE